MPTWICPKCGETVDPGFDVCWQCGTAADGTEDPSFLSADESGAIVDPVEDAEFAGDDELGDEFGESLPNLVACFGAVDVAEAQFVANQLRERGIPAIADRHDVTLGRYMLGASGSPLYVRVRPQDLDRARAWIGPFEQHRREKIASESD
jgi:hypothetical protein